MTCLPIDELTTSHEEMVDTTRSDEVLLLVLLFL